MVSPLKRWVQGQVIGAGQLNDMVDRLGAYTPLTGRWPIVVQPSANGGAVIADARPPTAEADFDAIITAKGPNGKADFTDARYWVKPAVIAVKDFRSFALDADVAYYNLPDPNTLSGDSPGEVQQPWPIPVINVGELPPQKDETTRDPPDSGTHALLPGRPVRVSASYDLDGNRYFTINVRAAPVDCLLLTDGGTDGNQTTAPSYTYTLTQDGTTNTAFAHNVSPSFQRSKGTFLSAGIGLAVYRGGGWRLWWADEVPNTGACSA